MQIFGRSFRSSKNNTSRNSENCAPPSVSQAALGTRLTIDNPIMPNVISGMTVPVEVTIRNESPVDLVGSEDSPIKLSYHIIDSATGAMIVHDGFRTSFGPVLPAGRQRTLTARVPMPYQSGPVILRMSLIYERNFWFSELVPESTADVSLIINAHEAWIETAGEPGIFAPHKHLNNNYIARFIRFNGTYRPLMLFVETVNICNNHCIICAYDHQTRKKQRMPLDMFREIIRQYEDMGGGRLDLTPVEGDVFLDRSLPERLEIIAAKRGVVRHLSVYTNAAYTKLYDDNELRQILAHFDEIHISVYGIDAEEFSVMTQTCDYDLTRTGIERIIRCSHCEIKLGFRSLKSRSAHELQRWTESIPGFHQAADRVRFNGNARKYANWGIPGMTSKVLPFGAEWITPKVGNKAQCGVPLLALQVFSNGNVSFCHCDDFDNNQELHLGNVMETSLSEMFNSPKAKKLWNWETNGIPNFCKGCTFHRSLSDLISIPGLFEDWSCLNAHSDQRLSIPRSSQAS